MYKTNRKTFCILMALVLVLGSCTLAFAADTTSAADNQIQPRAVSTCGIEVERLSNTSGTSTVDASFAGIAESATCTAYLMEYSGGSLSEATGVSPIKQSRTVKDRAGLLLVSDWNLKSGKIYKIKVVLKDTIDGVTYTSTYYSNQF